MLQMSFGAATGVRGEHAACRALQRGRNLLDKKDFVPHGHQEPRKAHMKCSVYEAYERHPFSRGFSAKFVYRVLT